MKSLSGAVLEASHPLEKTIKICRACFTTRMPIKQTLCARN